MFPAGIQQCACGGTGGGEACPPGPRSEPEPLRRSTWWKRLLGSKKREGGVGNQEKVRIHTHGAWLNKHMGAAKEEEKDIDKISLKITGVESQRTATPEVETFKGFVKRHQSHASRINAAAILSEQH